MSMPVHISIEQGGALLQIRLARPKANVIDDAMITALRSALVDQEYGKDLKAILLSAEGPNFSFGAGVEEHLPDQCADMLSKLHGLILGMLESRIPIIAAVQGQCLGGGLELAMAADLIFAAPQAHFGQPEIRLGVFAPVASCLLPEIVGPVHARDLLMSGRSIDADEAKQIGLVFEVADDPHAAALSYIATHLNDKSAAALGFACRAMRLHLTERVRDRLKQLEDVYLNGLMATHDAVEGLNAFLEKRPARWENR